MNQTNIFRFSKRIFPGMMAALGITMISKGIAIYLPALGAATIAILLGILLGNTCLTQPILEPGTRVAESRFLEYSVVCLGMTVTFQTIGTIGLQGGLFTVFLMLGTILGVFFIGKRLKFSENIIILMAGGNAVCGSSAIGSIAPVIEATDEEKGQTITLVNLLGTLLMLTLPVLSTTLFPKWNVGEGALIGGILPSVGQVVASGSMVSESVLEFSMLFKIMRVMLLVVVVFAFGKLKEGKREASHAQVKRKGGTLPWYIIGFLVLCILNSLGIFSETVTLSVRLFSNWLEITALAAIGLRLNVKKFLAEGTRYMIFGGAVGVLQIALAVLLIQLFLR